MDIDFLPLKVVKALNKYNKNLVYDIRFRLGFPIKINIMGEKKVLYNDFGQAVICTQDDINDILNNLTENSLYAFNDQIKEGYLTSKCGIRVGIAGECVTENDKIITIKNPTSLNVRIPHKIFGASDVIYEKVFNNEVYNSLIISPPFTGKTTILKDLARRFNDESGLDILIIDERGEFSTVKGENIDVISNRNKKDAFLMGIRSLSPDVVIMDELGNANDFLAIEYAITCGVKIIATVHGDNEKDLIQKPYMKAGVFERFIFLDKGVEKGVLKKVLDGDFNEV